MTRPADETTTGPPRRYVVVSPEYSYTEPLFEDGSGPTHWERDAALVEAPNANEAKWAAFRHWQQLPGDRYPTETRLDRKHPLSGVTARRVTSADEEYDPSQWHDDYIPPAHPLQAGGAS